jgi:hypothetical protein
MKKIKRIAGLVAVLLFLGANVLAVDLRNEDGTKYEVKIHDGPSTLNTSIDGNSSQFSVCSSCVIEVVGVGSIRASGSERVVIKDGKLRKE